MAKLNSLTTVTFLLFLTLVHVLARPVPTTHGVVDPVETRGTINVQVDENRGRGVEEDEGMTRRTLEAHLDYIYTQNHKNP